MPQNNLSRLARYVTSNSTLSYTKALEYVEVRRSLPDFPQDRSAQKIFLLSHLGTAVWPGPKDWQGPSGTPFLTATAKGLSIWESAIERYPSPLPEDHPDPSALVTSCWRLLILIAAAHLRNREDLFPQEERRNVQAALFYEGYKAMQKSILEFRKADVQHVMQSLARVGRHAMKVSLPASAKRQAKLAAHLVQQEQLKKALSAPGKLTGIVMAAADLKAGQSVALHYPDNINILQVVNLVNTHDGHVQLTLADKDLVMNYVTVERHHQVDALFTAWPEWYVEKLVPGDIVTLLDRDVDYGLHAKALFVSEDKPGQYTVELLQPRYPNTIFAKPVVRRYQIAKLA